MTVLIADHDKDFRHAVKQALAIRREIGIVWEAGDGEEAVELVRRVQPDLVLMAMSMPRLDGLEATRLIKSKQPEVQVVMFSVHIDEVYRRAAIDSGADAFSTSGECWTRLAGKARLLSW